MWQWKDSWCCRSEPPIPKKNQNGSCILTAFFFFSFRNSERLRRRHSEEKVGEKGVTSMVAASKQGRSNRFHNGSGEEFTHQDEAALNLNLTPHSPAAFLSPGPWLPAFMHWAAWPQQAAASLPSYKPDPGGCSEHHTKAALQMSPTPSHVSVKQEADRVRAAHQGTLWLWLSIFL